MVGIKNIMDKVYNYTELKPEDTIIQAGVKGVLEGTMDTVIVFGVLAMGFAGAALISGKKIGLVDKDKKGA